VMAARIANAIMVVTPIRIVRAGVRITKDLFPIRHAAAVIVAC
jgi:hypothetical protein